MIALVAGGVVAGGVLASSVAANAEGKAPPAGYGYGGPGPGGPGFGRGHGTPLTTDQLAKLKAAIEKKYPGATVDGSHAESDGYDALITKKDGTHARIELDKAFAITGEDAGGPGRGFGPGHPKGTPLTADQLAKLKAAIEKKYPGATVDGSHAESDGYDALITKKDGTHVRVELDKAFAVTGEDTAPAGRHGGRPGGPGGGPEGPPPAAPPQSG
ncbi:MAG: hypothetical protein JWM71_1811 [Solirubrobacteraceae bacterium]|nr:hypothetical protein [Solirubrobacteraceae bacterium]